MPRKLSETRQYYINLHVGGSVEKYVDTWIRLKNKNPKLLMYQASTFLDYGGVKEMSVYKH